MAHSIQNFRGKTVILRDLDTIVIMLFALQVISRKPESNILTGLGEQWKTALSNYGLGTLELDLDKLINSQDEINALTALLSEIEGDLSHYGKTVPAAALNEMNPVSGVIFFEHQASTIIKTGRSLSEMLLG